MKAFDPRDYVKAVLEAKPNMSSKEIAEFLKSRGHNVSWQVIAGIKGSLKGA